MDNKNKMIPGVFELDNLGIGYFQYAFVPEERFIRMNKSFLKILGYRLQSQLKNLTLEDLFVSQDEKQRFISALKKKKRVNFSQAVFRGKNGKDIWVAISAYSKSRNGKQKFIQGIIEDITTQKKIEKEALIERDFLEGLLDNIPDAIYFKDCKNRIIKVNKFYLQGVKLKPEEVIGKTDFDFFPKEQAQEMFDDDTRVLKTGKPIIGKIERTLLPNGTWNQVITTKIPMYDRQGKIIGTMGITRDMTAYANLENERFAMLMSALTVLGKALEMRDPYTFTHTQNVAVIVEKIGRALGWDANRLLGIRLAAEIHDLGKISIPLDILNKPGKLSELEYQLIQEHVEKCYSLIKDIKCPFSLSEIVYQHHERLDGSGYPQGIKGDDITLEARILAIGDVLESMTSHRPYRAALGLDNALDELEKGSGVKYDRDLVHLVKEMVESNGGKAFWLN